MENDWFTLAAVTATIKTFSSFKWAEELTIGFLMSSISQNLKELHLDLEPQGDQGVLNRLH